MLKNNKFVGLIILDGFGLRNEINGNAIKLANPINFDYYFKNYPSTKLSASGEAVGLPKDQMGNSEVGHLNIGAGKIVNQSLQKINNSIKTGEFYSNVNIIDTLTHAIKNNSTLHIMGVLSDGGVHGHINHLFALLKMAKKSGVKKVAVHAFLDGRDTAFNGGLKFVKQLKKELKNYDNYNIATVMGRSYAMDREQNYDKTKMAYNAIVFGNAEYYSNDVISAVKNSYLNNVYDEFIKPIVITKDEQPIGTVNNNDAVIFYNFREDRARQLTASLIENFNEFNVKKLSNVKMCTFTCYDDDFKKPIVAFPKDDLSVNLSSVISENGLKQFKIAETTKYAHVTYFINGGIEQPFKNEDRVLVETIKDVPFEKVPQMRAVEITDKAIQLINSKKYSYMVINYSNPDMVGHTGDLQATIKAIKVVDDQLKRLVDQILAVNGTAVIVADHGNAELMLDKKGNVVTSHTTNKVPFIIVNNNFNGALNKQGVLGNVAPTILQLLGIKSPKEFELPSLIVNN